MIVWDRLEQPSATSDEVLCWQSYVQGDRISSVPRYLEDHAEPLRAKYLAFIHDLSEYRIDGKRVVDHLNRGDGFSFWWMTLLAEKSPFKSPRIYDCLRLMALEDILREKRPSSLTLVSDDRDLARAIRTLGRNLGIGFSWQRPARTGRDWSLRGLYRALPHPIQGLISLGKYVAARMPIRKSDIPDWFAGDEALFLCSHFIHLDLSSCGEGRFYSKQWEGLPRYLHDHGRRTNWLQHFMHGPGVPDVQSGLGWLRSFNRDPDQQGCHAFLDAYLSWTVIARALKTWCWLNVVSRRLKPIQSAFSPKGSAVWLWPMLGADWLASVAGRIAITNCLWVELFDAALVAMPRQKVGLYLWEIQAWERALLRAWRKHGHGDITGVMHTAVPFWHLQSFDDPRTLRSNQACAMPQPDRVAVNSPGAFNVLAESGYRADQLVEVEALRYLNLSTVIARPASASPQVDVLVLGDISPTSMRTFLTIVEDAAKLLAAGYRFTFKAHPGYAVNLADYPGLEADETNEPLEQILGDYDVAVSANATSAAVSAYQAGLRVIVALDGGHFNLSPLRGQPGVRFVGTSEELADALQQRRQTSTMADVARPELFFMDPALPRWERLLSRAAPVH